MKKLFILPLAAISLAAFSCKPESGPDINSPEPVKILLEKAEVGYYADYYESGVANYYVQLYTGDVDAEGYLVGESVSVAFDLFAPIESVMDIPAGEYAISTEYLPFTYEKGVDETWRSKLTKEAEELSKIFEETVTLEEVMASWEVSADELDDLIYLYGADFYVQDAQENYKDRAITNGNLVVSKTGDRYSFVICFELDGVNYECIYTGTLDIKDYSGQGGGGQGGGDSSESDISFAGTYAQVTNWGASWEGAPKDHNTWSILAYVSKTATNGGFVELDVVTEPTGVLADGTYDIVAPQAANIVPGVAVGYYEDYGWGFGCWYGVDGGITHEGNTGSVTISHPGGKLKVSFTFKDTVLDKTVSGTITEGDIDYFDYRTSVKTNVYEKVSRENSVGRHVRRTGTGILQRGLPVH